jgi:transposase
MSVIIGVDPHKATHTAVAVDRNEVELARAKVRATRNQVPQLLTWAEPLGDHTWAIESAGGLGYLLSQQLVAAGETVLDVPSTLAARIRVLGSRRSDKNDPNDALSVAVAALRSPELRVVVRADHAEMMRLLAKRNIDIGNQRTRVVCRLHNLLMELRPGGIGQELYASHAQRFLDDIRPASPAEHARLALAAELLDDIRVLDEQLKTSHRRIRTAIAASDTTLTDLYGVGPIIACYLIGYTGDISRFANRDAYAAYNGTAPVERSSGGRVVHRVSQRGNRKLNHALHLAAICQIRNPGTEGRIYFERKVAEGKTKKDAIRSLKRHVSNAVWQPPRRPPEPGDVAGPGGHPGTSLSSSVAGSHPAHRLFGPSHFPDPDPTLRLATPGVPRRARTAPEVGS